MRRVRSVVCTTVALSVFVVALASAASSPYPAMLTMHRGLTFSNTGRSLPWGTRLTATQARWVTFTTSGPTYRWGVWQAEGTPAQFPVRSTDGGDHWAAAGPQLASDWAGGALYYVTRVIGEGPRVVAMVSNAIIDVTTDGGHQWYQYLHPAANWSITAHRTGGGAISLRVAPATWSTSPKGSFAIYVLDAAQHRWDRTRQSPG